jgi:hypothetical protein
MAARAERAWSAQNGSARRSRASQEPSKNAAAIVVEDLAELVAGVGEDAGGGGLVGPVEEEVALDRDVMGAEGGGRCQRLPRRGRAEGAGRAAGPAAAARPGRRSPRPPLAPATAARPGPPPLARGRRRSPDPPPLARPATARQTRHRSPDLPPPLARPATARQTCRRRRRRSSGLTVLIYLLFNSLFAHSGDASSSYFQDA